MVKRVEVKVTQNDPELNKQLVIAALRELLCTLSLRSDDQIEKKIGKEKLQDFADDVAGIIHKATAGQELRRIERAALVSRMLRCLANYIEVEMKIPVTVNTICTHSSLLEYAVDIAFPGYIRAGVLRYAILPPRSAA